MTNVTVSDDKLVIEVEGLDKLWSLRSRLEIPLGHVAGAVANPSEAHAWWKGFRVGTHMPGVIAAGSFYHHGEWVFWDVHDADNTVAVELHDERYRRLIIEVANPADVVARIQQALAKQNAAKRIQNQ